MAAILPLLYQILILVLIFLYQNLNTELDSSRMKHLSVLLGTNYVELLLYDFKKLYQFSSTELELLLP